MKLTEHSKHRIKNSAQLWDVPSEYYQPMYDYLVNGFEPGSFFTALLANNALDAIQASHPANTLVALKTLTGWIRYSFPLKSFGSYEHVKEWLAYSEDTRRQLLINKDLIYTAEDEVILILSGTKTTEPVLF